MKKIVGFFFVFYLFSAGVYAQSIQEKLLKDIVTISNNKMIIQDFTMLNKSDGSSIQIKSYAEAPYQGTISRDNFVANFTYLNMYYIDELKKDDEYATTKTLDEIIGNPDIEINCYMAKSGIQIEVKSSEGTKRQTTKWEDLFPE